MKNRICFIVQRYGLEVNGGAELHCRQLAEKMCDHYNEVHVLTSKAIDYMTWKNEYKCDEEIINRVHIHRFPVIHTRNQDEFNVINAKFLSGNLLESEEREWIEKQGPAVPCLIDYLKEEKDNYDVFIFFTYLYYPTVLGVEEVKEKAIVIPTAHDEPFHKMKIFRNVFMTPRFFFYNTEEERCLIHKLYQNDYIPSDLGGTGVEIPDKIDAKRFKAKYKLDNFILYVGRIDEGKNCHQLFQFFQEYKKRNKNDIKLVLMGKPVIPIPKNDDIISLGFVSEQDKYDGMAAANLLILPSKFESLSMVVLEAMSVLTPVIVNGACEVLKGHCIKSNGAFYYQNYFEFEGEINYILNNPDIVEIMCQNAKKYVEENYCWDIIEKRLCNLIEQI
ncbi:glycosyltransferase family 4 protein [Velocimicrobium porci]|uniref:Glycosyltransferase family 4 protein n=1 Tax=Velocimicrobium porci TaxID=2606634 RepID=A0A6L5Y1B4_9FIRM|nr:glycosyltransferase family 4 protein [Velocimicrobium porci]MSS64501.1 glycosyltransferase family 4 protein [Velocimicrobium porci]